MDVRRRVGTSIGIALTLIVGTFGCRASPDATPAATTHETRTTVPTTATITESTESTEASTAATDVPTVSTAGAGLDVRESLSIVSFERPANSTPFPADRPNEPLPDFVVDQTRFLVGECCRVGVTLESVSPPFADPVLETFEANGLTWTVYDIGPQDGSVVVANAVLPAPIEGVQSIQVSAQIYGGDRDSPGGQPAALATSVAATLIVSPDG